LDLFCGIGGFSLGFALALDGASIRGIDVNQRAVETYNLNLARFNCWAEMGDLLTWEPDGEYDVVVGGPPCQPFSVANTVRVGEAHPLFPTFRRYFELVRAIRPVAFVFENVKGLLTQRFRPLLDAQLGSLMADYRIRHAVLNAAHYGVPQMRERLIAVGVRKDVGVAPALPEPTHAQAEMPMQTRRLYRWLTVREAIGDLLEYPLVVVHGGHSDERRESVVSDGPSRTVGTMSGGGRSRTTMYLLVCGPANTITGKHRSGQLVEVPWTAYQDKHPPLDLDRPSRAVVSHVGKYSRDLLVPLGQLGRACIYRRLTVRECLRIQSFPDWWMFPESVSMSGRYELVGEVVPPIFSYRIAIAVGKALGYPVREPPRKEEWDLPYFERAFADYFDDLAKVG